MKTLIIITILLVSIISTIIGFVLLVLIIKLLNQVIKYFKLLNIKLKLELGIKDEKLTEIKTQEENNENYQNIIDEINTKKDETGWL